MLQNSAEQMSPRASKTAPRGDDAFKPSVGGVPPRVQGALPLEEEALRHSVRDVSSHVLGVIPGCDDTLQRSFLDASSVRRKPHFKGGIGLLLDGCSVSEVVPWSACAHAGLQIGDIILKVNDATALKQTVGQVLREASGPSHHDTIKVR